MCATVRVRSEAPLLYSERVWYESDKLKMFGSFV